MESLLEKALQVPSLQSKTEAGAGAEQPHSASPNGATTTTTTHQQGIYAALNDAAGMIDHTENIPVQGSYRSISSTSSMSNDDMHPPILNNEEPATMAYSDFTVPTSNRFPPRLVPNSPPSAVPRRTILGGKVKTKYLPHGRRSHGAYSFENAQSNDDEDGSDADDDKFDSLNAKNGWKYADVTPRSGHKSTPSPYTNANKLSNQRIKNQARRHHRYQQQQQHQHQQHHQQQHQQPPPPLGPPSTPPPPISSTYDALPVNPTSPLTPMDRGPQRTQLYTDHPRTPSCDMVSVCSSTNANEAVHETIHAQSLILGLAFMAIWSANNVMAPNLTQMADFFGMDESQRDLYLGSYCALAVGVFSLPLSALIGILTDFVPRKYLFVATVAGGSIASAATGMATNYTALLVARLVNGGCMSGSVPVAFSLLGDLFVAEERNAASSGLTAMMGLGIISGQVYAGVVGSSEGWSHAFFVSSMFSAVLAVCVLLWVREPIRGGKERVLQDMIKSGTTYDRQLTWKGFVHTLKHNRSNRILIWQGFFSSVPWGIIFVFLNDFLSQEKGFSVPDATFMVMLFGIGCAIGGVVGGYLGQLFMRINRSYLPLFMSASTLLGFFPFYGLLNSTFANPRGYLAMFYATSGGIIASLPSVNVRPCIINVNPPETRGATLTAANLIIMLARGVGPSCITLLGVVFHADRQSSFNITLLGFWLVSSIQLLFLSRTLPKDQDRMETELAKYAEEAVELARANRAAAVRKTQHLADTRDDDDSLVSIEERMTSFDANAARQSLKFMRMGIREISEEVIHYGHFDKCGDNHAQSPMHEVEYDDMIDEGGMTEETKARRAMWLKLQAEREAAAVTEAPTERTRLFPID